jgi:hypothetical protein
MKLVPANLSFAALICFDFIDIFFFLMLHFLEARLVSECFKGEFMKIGLFIPFVALLLASCTAPQSQLSSQTALENELAELAAIAKSPIQQPDPDFRNDPSYIKVAEGVYRQEVIDAKGGTTITMFADGTPQAKVNMQMQRIQDIDKKIAKATDSQYRKSLEEQKLPIQKLAQMYQAQLIDKTGVFTSRIGLATCNATPTRFALAQSMSATRGAKANASAGGCNNNYVSVYACSPYSCPGYEAVSDFQNSVGVSTSAVAPYSWCNSSGYADNTYTSAYSSYSC